MDGLSPSLAGSIAAALRLPPVGGGSSSGEEKRTEREEVATALDMLSVGYARSKNEGRGNINFATHPDANMGCGNSIRSNDSNFHRGTRGLVRGRMERVKVVLF